MADNRSRFQILMEDVLRFRVKPMPPESDELPITAGTDKDLVNIVDNLDAFNGAGLLSDLQEFRELSSDAETRYRIFDEMETDSVISSALDMYADDATQYNKDGDVIWAESEDEDVAKFANRLIDIFQLNAKSWGYVRSLIKYGDFFIELFRDDETGDDSDPYNIADQDSKSGVKIYKPKIGSEIEEYIEPVQNPATVYELSRKGKTVGYVKTKENDSNSTDPQYHYQVVQVSDEDILLPSDKYIHIYIPSNDRFEQSIDIEISNLDDKPKLYNYKINRGKSILHDLFKSYKELKLMEDAILLNRATRSSIIRILQIEMGDMPKSQARETLKRFKSIIEQKNYLDKNDGRYISQAAPGPIDNCIYVPTYNGKGAISSSNLGGDVDIKSIVDLDYFRQKLAGGLKIPLSYISGTSQENGLGGGTSLTKIDARYARTIKRIQNAYIQGITNLINIFAISRGLDTHVNNFTIKMVSPTTIEDADRNEEMSSNIDIVSSMLDIFSNLEMTEEVKQDIVVYLTNTYLNEPELSKILKKNKIEPESDEETSSFDNIPGGIGGGNSDMDFDVNIDNGPDEFGQPVEEPTEEPETTGGDEGFGDFEDEYNEEV